MWNVISRGQLLFATLSSSLETMNVRSEVDDVYVYRIPRPNCPPVAPPDTSSVWQRRPSDSVVRRLHGERLRGASQASHVVRISGRSFVHRVMICEAVTTLVRRSHEIQVQQWSQQSTRSLLAASWSQQTTHCWSPVDHNKRHIVGVESFCLFAFLNETDYNKSYSVRQSTIIFWVLA